jgi:hypothetical protein
VSLLDYQRSKDIAEQEHPFYALVMAAMRRADSTNFELLKMAFPYTAAELQERYDAPSGLLPGERNEEGWYRDSNGSLRNPEGKVVRHGG